MSTCFAFGDRKEKLLYPTSIISHSHIYIYICLFLAGVTPISEELEGLKTSLSVQIASTKAS